MPRRKIIYILISVILAGGLVWAGYFLGSKKEIFQEEAEKPEAIVSNQMEAGAVGEVMAEEEKTGKEALLVTSTMPPAIFSTAGAITKIEADRLEVRSNGTHFADGVDRTITVIFTEDTATFVSGQAFKWKGFAGLKQLKEGTQIVVESPENIRGKVEFQVKTVNIL